jgi:hypothetical protein
MSEKLAYKEFRKGICHKNDRIDRVENLMVLGIPDVNVCSDGFESWIELKTSVEPKRKTTPLMGSNHKLSIDQRNWMMRQVKAGGRCYILISTDKRWLLINGNYADFVNEQTVEQLIKVAEWNTVKSGKIDWDDLRKVLTK